MDLLDKAELINTSLKLHSIIRGLKKISHRKRVGREDTKYFEWGADLLGQIDWSSEHYAKMEHPEMSVIAARLRPGFYEALLNHGISSSAGFSERIYRTLKSRGREIQLEPEELEQTYRVFDFIADRITIRLNHNNI